MPAAPNSSFEEGVARALASIGAAASDLALDALAAPAAVTAALHLWRGRTLISVAGGTAVYMLLVQCVF